MSILSLLNATNNLKDVIQNSNKFVETFAPADLIEIIKFHSAGTATAGEASGWIPMADGAVATVISGGFIWTMYVRINSKIGLNFSENVIKSIATGVATNLAAYFVAGITVSTALSFFPGIGSLGATAVIGTTCYALTIASGIVYLKLLTKLFLSGKDPTKLTEDELKKTAEKITKDENIKDIIDNAKSEYKSNSK